MATAFLDSYDYDAIDTEQAIAQWQAREDAAISAQSPAEQQPRLQGDDR